MNRRDFFITTWKNIGIPIVFVCFLSGILQLVYAGASGTYWILALLAIVVGYILIRKYATKHLGVLRNIGGYLILGAAMVFLGVNIYYIVTGELDYTIESTAVVLRDITLFVFLVVAMSTVQKMRREKLGFPWILARFKKYLWRILLLVLLLGWYANCIPDTLFVAPNATVVKARNNELMGAVIAKDGQWRFPELDSVPNKFKACILQFEDAYFYKHMGFNPVSIVRAFQQNRKANRIVRGGSTLTQQVVRLARKNKKRSYLEKCIELIWATRVELGYSKEEILKLYASHAPFGGNVVGLEMAAWRYYGLAPHQLSWAESATLAVLPNAPSLIYPGKNQSRLKAKRNALLDKLLAKKIIDSITCELAKEEELPQKPYPLPSYATHVVQRLATKHPGQQLQTSLDAVLQRKVQEQVRLHYRQMKQNEVHNAAVLVLRVKDRKVLSYVGNSPTTKIHHKDVDNIIARRSTGSTLKPILYGHMLHAGELLPTQLLADIPVEIAGYSPKNFSLKFDGAVPANEALTRSLNIPAVRMLQRYGLEKFRDELKGYRLQHLDKSAEYYGLSLILGGAEASLWDLCKTYAGYSGMVSHFEALDHQYYSNEFAEPVLLEKEQVHFGNTLTAPQHIGAGAAFLTLETLTEVNRPTSSQAWKYYDSAQKIAWKTGTSFGNKDAWAIGVTKDYVVGVWIGNSDGEGRPDLTGVSSAGPLLFNVFELLPKSDWFVEPHEDLVAIELCERSGYLALPLCPKVEKLVPQKGEMGAPCPYHKEITVDMEEKFRVNASCESVDKRKQALWFVLPPIMEHYYKQKDIFYRALPPMRSDCVKGQEKMMDFVFPAKKWTKLSLTKGIDGKVNGIVLKLTHRNPNTKVHWYLDDRYLGSTTDVHEFLVKPALGIHTLTTVDEQGNKEIKFIELY